MSSHAPRPEEDKGTILPFRRHGRTVPRVPHVPADTPIEDVGKYARGEEPDNYRHRMINNGLAFVACVVLALIGIWLATSIADMRRNQDCVLSGRRGCTPVVVPPANPN
jgi:hypothetical protein